MANIIYEQGYWTTLVDITTTLTITPTSDSNNYTRGYWELPYPWPKTPGTFVGIQWPVVRNPQGL